jgi:hypothetical protein
MQHAHSLLSSASIFCSPIVIVCSYVCYFVRPKGKILIRILAYFMQIVVHLSFPFFNFTLIMDVVSVQLHLLPDVSQNFSPTSNLCCCHLAQRFLLVYCLFHFSFQSSSHLKSFFWNLSDIGLL